MSCVVFISCQAERIQPPADRIKMLHQWLDSSRRTPPDLMREEFEQGRSVILIHHTIVRGDTIELVRALVPLFHNLGIRKLGLYYIDITHQENLDTYYNNGVPSPAQAVSLAYAEYSDFLEYIKNFNDARRLGEDAMNVVALSENGSISLPEANQLLDEGNSFLWLRLEDLEQIQKSPHKQNPLILTHYGPESDGLRWDGLVESVNVQRSIHDRTFAFHPDDTPFSLWHYDDIILPNIVIVTAAPYRAAHTIPEFITPKTIENVLKFFPDIRVWNAQQMSLSRMNRIIRRQAKRYNHYLRKKYSSMEPVL